MQCWRQATGCGCAQAPQFHALCAVHFAVCFAHAHSLLSTRLLRPQVQAQLPVGQLHRMLFALLPSQISHMEACPALHRPALQDGGYHVSVAHPELAAGLDLPTYRSTMYERLSIQSCQPAGAQRAGQAAADAGAGHGGAGSEQRRLGAGRPPAYVFIYPNLMINRQAGGRERDRQGRTHDRMFKRFGVCLRAAPATCSVAASMQSWVSSPPCLQVRPMAGRQHCVAPCGRPLQGKQGWKGATARGGGCAAGRWHSCCRADVAPSSALLARAALQLGSLSHVLACAGAL